MYCHLDLFEFPRGHTVSTHMRSRCLIVFVYNQNEQFIYRHLTYDNNIYVGCGTGAWLDNEALPWRAKASHQQTPLVEIKL